AEDATSGAVLLNSPAHMTKVRFTLPVHWQRVEVSPELWSMSSRRTVAGATVDPAITANLTLRIPLGPHMELRGTALNLFNASYADPGSDDLRQDTILQN